MDIRDYQVDERTTSSRSFKKNEETTTLSAAKNCLYYNMNHKKTGIAVIFNHEIYFHQLGFLKRKGSGSDCLNLENTLNNMGFETEKYLDLTVKEIGAVLDKLVEKDYSDYDCLFIAILSHGDPGVIYAKDSHYPVETLFQRFKSDKCPTLDGKPKIYAIQACRGNKYDHGISVRTIDVDSDSNDTKYPFPLFAEILNADFLIACSTFPGHYSWRNERTGSWFIQVLCEELNKHCYEYDLLTILTMVNGKVSFDFESDRPLYPSEHKKKQIPCITTMLTKILKFNPKNVVRA